MTANSQARSPERSALAKSVARTRSEGSDEQKSLSERSVSVASLDFCRSRSVGSADFGRALIFWFFCIKTKEHQTRKLAQEQGFGENESLGHVVRNIR